MAVEPTVPSRATVPSDETVRIELRSDNSAGAAPEIIEAVVAANVGSDMAYGGDGATARLTEQVREVFEHPDATIHPVVSGTAANALAISALTPPWGAVVCHETAHILVNEPGSTTMFSGGAVLQPVGGDAGRIDPEALRAHLTGANWGDPHASQPSALSLTVPSDLGTVLGPDQVATLTGIAREYGLRSHLDGSRLANALAALDVAPADLTWRAGVDVLSLGAIKNGGLSSDAVVCFDPELADGFRYRTKRSGHTASKMRYQSAQLAAYLADGLWLDLAGRSNAAMGRLVAGLDALGLTLEVRPEVNMVFVRLDDGAASALHAAGVDFYRIRPGLVRFVTNWTTTDAEVDEVLARLGRVVGAAT